MIHQLIFTLLGLCIASGAGAAPASAPAGGFETLGLYTDLSAPETIGPFLKTCGYNTLEFCDLTPTLNPENQEPYQARLAEAVRRGRVGGFRVYMILLSNVAPHRTPQGARELLQFTPGDEEKMTARLDQVTAAVRKTREADGFIFFAGDPGGDPQKKSSLSDCLAMARQVKAIVNREAPAAEFIFNSWAIAAWRDFPSPFALEFWETETDLTRQVLGERDWLGPGVSVELPMHNYYRPLAIKCFAEQKKRPVLFPNRADLDDLKSRGVRRVWAWPYFLIDECDDGHTGATWRQTQFEARYLHRVVSDARGLGFNGIVGNLSGPSFKSEALNTYAFARFARDPAATPQSVLREFSRFVTEDRFADELATILAYVENHSSWHLAIPEAYRLPDLSIGGLKSSDEAARGLAAIAPQQSDRSGLPLTPAEFLTAVATRLKELSKQQDKP